MQARKGGRKACFEGMPRVVIYTLAERLKRAQEEDDKIYDEVSEDQYRRIVKGRLMEDDFVVDDGVEGYMDNGMDDWAGGDQDAEESDEGYDKPKKGLFLHLWR